MGFTKLDENLVTSSIWSEDDKTLRVWVYLMARAGANGAVLDTIPAIARACGYSLADVETVLERLAGPDKYSRSPEMSGRRIAIVHEPEFAIHLVNHSKYREKDHTAAERQRRHRAKQRDVTRDTVTVTQAEAEAEAEDRSRERASVAVDPTLERRSDSFVLVDAVPPIEEYGGAIVDEWRKLRGADLPETSNKDFLQLQDWHGSGIPLRVVLRGIADCIETMRKRKDKPQGKPLAYYNSAVRQAYGQWRKAIA